VFGQVLVANFGQVLKHRRLMLANSIVYNEFGGGGGNRTPVRKVSSKGLYMLILWFRSYSGKLPRQD